MFAIPNNSNFLWNFHFIKLIYAINVFGFRSKMISKSSTASIHSYEEHHKRWRGKKRRTLRNSEEPERNEFLTSIIISSEWNKGNRAYLPCSIIYVFLLLVLSLSHLKCSIYQIVNVCMCCILLAFSRIHCGLVDRSALIISKSAYSLTHSHSIAHIETQNAYIQHLIINDSRWIFFPCLPFSTSHLHIPTSIH